jgi:hypothetical protein
MHVLKRLVTVLSLAGGITTLALPAGTPVDAAPGAQKETRGGRTAAAVTAARQYVEAMAAGDRVKVGQLDFACLYHLVSAHTGRISMPPPSDPLYTACWEPIAAAHSSAIERREQAMDVLWPGRDRLVFFREELSGYPASTFVMDLIGLSPPGSGLTTEFVEMKSLPSASFRLRDKVRPAKATLVKLRVTYKDPLTGPVTYAPGAYKWTNTVKRPRRALRSVTLQWVVLGGLRKQGFPTDIAVLNLPVSRLEDETKGIPEAIPFATETSHADPATAVWWGPADSPGLLIAAVGRAALLPELPDRIAMLNRVLIIDPGHAEALTLLTRNLYSAILRDATAAHNFSFPDPVLATRFDELYWDTYAQTTRMDIALGMEMGGFAKATTADLLYRMIPAMEKLAEVRPSDFENRLRLGNAYRWNNDQLAALRTHESLLAETPKERALFRTRVLLELAWSRIAKVAWNRSLDDPLIGQAYQAAEEAFHLTDLPVDKFLASYTMAYSLAFMPQRDNHKMLEHLTEARRWFQQLGGATEASWQYLLSNDTLKGIVVVDPLFKPLLTSSAAAALALY